MEPIFEGTGVGIGITNVWKMEVLITKVIRDRYRE